ncbi:MAG: sulfotransferase family 2 domain-containing protein [Vicingaceae bacterium]
MMISHKKKLIFIHVHRTGGTSFGNILREKLDDSFEPFFQHTNAMTVEAEFFEKHRDYYKLGFTRNPWARILSWYSLINLNDQKSMAEERSRLEEFIEVDHAADFAEQSFHYNALDYFTNKRGELMVDKIYRYENLHQEINTIANQLNLHPIEIPTLNTTIPKDYREYYTDKSRRLLAQKCKKDIDYFNYTF